MRSYARHTDAYVAIAALAVSSKVYRSFMTNSRPRMSPKRGRTSSRNLRAANDEAGNEEGTGRERGGNGAGQAHGAINTGSGSGKGTGSGVEGRHTGLVEQERELTVRGHLRGDQLRNLLLVRRPQEHVVASSVLEAEELVQRACVRPSWSARPATTVPLSQGASWYLLPGRLPAAGLLPQVRRQQRRHRQLLCAYVHAGSEAGSRAGSGAGSG